MASNSFGQIFRITTWGESHGRAIGVVIDGCPAGISITEEALQVALARRAPGRNPQVTARREPDRPEIYSGVFQGKTTGAPISIIMMNQDVDSQPYEATKDLMRPGHAQATYLAKYGVYDYRGGGRASARETACRVAAGVLAEKLLAAYGIQTHAYLQTLGDIVSPHRAIPITALKTLTHQSPIFCPDKDIEAQMLQYLERVKAAQDSVGGVVSFIATGLPAGLGDPVYEKLEAKLANAMLSIPASKGFEIGEGFLAAAMHGSSHNDHFESLAQTKTNHAGGTLGGISTGMPLWGRVVFKPTSSIGQTQSTVNLQGEPAVFLQAPGSRHDPCVAIRAVPVVEAMLNLVLADALLMNRCIQ
jgi:chorismate synthase